MVEIVGIGSAKDPNSLPLFTRSRDRIPNELREEYPPAILRVTIAMHAASHPNARLRTLSNCYNCMGMVFASRRTIIDTNSLGTILRGDGLKKLAGPAEAAVGDLVVYERAEADGFKTSHVGIISEKRIVAADSRLSGIWVLSKWGGSGEYFHQIEDVPPLLGSPKSFFTDRKT